MKIRFKEELYIQKENKGSAYVGVGSAGIPIYLFNKGGIRFRLYDETTSKWIYYKKFKLAVYGALKIILQQEILST